MGNEFINYLLVYFKGNHYLDEQIFFALSNDGYNWTPINDEKPIINSEEIALKKSIRDPHIIRTENGEFYMVATDMRSSDGWDSNCGIVLLKSNNLINWTSQTIDFTIKWPKIFNKNTIEAVWAPETIYDKKNNKYMVYYTIKEKNKNYMIYYSYANEYFTDLTEPKLLYNHNMLNTIDANIIYHNNKYHMFFKTEDDQSQGIQKATCDTLQGPWLPENEYIQKTHLNVEAPNVFKLNDNNGFILMYDCFMDNKYEYCYSDDLINFNKINSINNNIIIRHASVIPITKKETERLIYNFPNIKNNNLKLFIDNENL